jgi:hypothetical protein
MKQNLLFEADDRPERELGWIYNPSAPATEADLREFFKEVFAILKEVAR